MSAVDTQIKEDAKVLEKSATRLAKQMLAKQRKIAPFARVITQEGKEEPAEVQVGRNASDEEIVHALLSQLQKSAKAEHIRAACICSETTFIESSIETYAIRIRIEHRNGPSNQLTTTFRRLPIGIVGYAKPKFVHVPHKIFV